MPVAGLTEDRLHEPPGVGLALLLAAPYAVAGPVGAELFVAGLLALGFVAAAATKPRASSAATSSSAPTGPAMAYGAASSSASPTPGGSCSRPPVRPATGARSPSVHASYSCARYSSRRSTSPSETIDSTTSSTRASPSA